MSTRPHMADIIRDAIQRDQRTRYRIAMDSGVNQAVLGRFVHGERGLNLDTADRLCRALGLELHAARPARRGR